MITFITVYAKAIVAVIGASITAVLGVIAPNTDLFHALTILSVILTAASVAWVKNAPVTANGADKKTGEHVAS